MGEVKEGRGRPTKLNKARQNAVCDAYSIGCTQEMAASYANITVDTLKAWTQNGEIHHKRMVGGDEVTAEERALADFFVAITNAKLQAGIRWQQVIDNASNRDPAWALRMLQYRFPNEYRDPSRNIELTGKDGSDIPIRVVDYRNGLTTVAPGSDEDSD